MSRINWLRLALIVLVGVIIQVTIVTKLSLDALHPEIIWLFPVAAGLVGGAELGAVTGFGAGIALDCLQPTPFGLTALVATLLGYAIGTIAERNGLSLEGSSWWVTPLLGAGTSMLAVASYGLLGYIFGEDQFASVNYLALLPIVGVAAAVLTIPIWMAVNWSFGERKGQRRISTEVTNW